MNFSVWIRKQRIAVLMGGESAERSISIKTGQAVLRSLKRRGFNAQAIDPRANLAIELKRRRITFAYIALHGPGGEDGSVQGLLQWMKIPYSGSGVLASSLAMDKISSKRLFDSAQLPTAKWTVIRRSEYRTIGTAGVLRAMDGFPIVVKPATQGSAIGVSIVKNKAALAPALQTAFRYDPNVLIEEFIEGREITVGIVGPLILPVIEIVPDRALPFYNFKAKYAPGGSRHVCPARISPADSRKASELARRACELLQIKAVARVDFIVHPKKGPLLLEVNTIPGMTETSLLPEAAQAAGLSFDQLVYAIMEQSVGTVV